MARTKAARPTRQAENSKDKDHGFHGFNGFVPETAVLGTFLFDTTTNLHEFTRISLNDYGNGYEKMFEVWATAAYFGLLRKR